MANALPRRDLKLEVDTVSTPEGDNEFAPDQPLLPSLVEEDLKGLQRWPSNSKMEYDKNRNTPENKSEEEESDGLERVIDEVSTGKIQP
jgi:hypothetical protein